MLRVRFLDGDPEVHARIRDIEAGPEGWSSACGMQFVFTDDPEAEIRVTLASGASWSYLGIGCTYVEANKPTMQLGWAHRSDDIELRRVWLHEAGHALSWNHEHDTYKAVEYFKFDFEAVKKWCKEEDVDYEEWLEDWVKHPIPGTVVDHEWYDPQSIMGYYMPGVWFLDGITRGGANRLSAYDRFKARYTYGPPKHPWSQVFLPTIMS